MNKLDLQMHSWNGTCSYVGDLLYSFSIAVITNYNKLSGLNNANLLFYSSVGVLWSKNQGIGRAMSFLEVLREDPLPVHLGH